MLSRVNSAVALAGVFWLSGCATASLVDAQPVTAAPPPLIGQAPVTVAIVETGPPIKDWRNKLTGISCKRFVWEAPPTRDEAVRKLLSLAQERGFNAVHSVVVGSDVRSLAMNCWEAFTATGVGFFDPTLISRPSTSL